MFNKWQAQQWWGENYDRIMELYNVQRFNRQALHTPPRSEDEVNIFMPSLFTWSEYIYYLIGYSLINSRLESTRKKNSTAVHLFIDLCSPVTYGNINSIIQKDSIVFPQVMLKPCVYGTIFLIWEDGPNGLSTRRGFAWIIKRQAEKLDSVSNIYLHLCAR